MSDSVIKVNNLSKSYLLSHEGTKERYTALRDVIARNAKNILRSTGNLLNGKQVICGDQVEEFWALRDVSFEVNRGEVLGIIGRNGAGKSTLLKILSRITEPTKGRIEIKGRIACLLEVGTGFHPELTGRENIFLNGAILGMTRAEIRRQFDAIVDFAEVEKFLDTPVKRYSSGMYVRLAFAVAAHLDPEILIVDEVLAVGDASFQKKCMGKMQDVATGGRAVIFVSHNMGAITSLCQTAIWLQGGNLIKKGTSRMIVEEYLTEKSESINSVLDLESMARMGEFGRKVRIERLEWSTQLPIQHGEKLSAKIRFKVIQDVEDLSIGIGFSSIEGTRLLTYETDFQDNFRPSFKAGTSHQIQVNIPEISLAPGLYSLDIGCRSGDFFGIDYISGACQMEVAIGINTPSHIVRYGAGVRLASKWEWLL